MFSVDSRELTNEIEQLRQELTDTGNKVKQESAVVKNKVNQEVTDLLIAIEDQDRQIGDMQKTLRRQAKQVSVWSYRLKSLINCFKNCID